MAVPRVAAADPTCAPSNTGPQSACTPRLRLMQSKRLGNLENNLNERKRLIRFDQKLFSDYI